MSYLTNHLLAVLLTKTRALTKVLMRAFNWVTVLTH